MADIAQDSKAQGSSPRTPSAPWNETWDAGARFYLVMTLIASAMIVIGFAPSFYLKSVIHAPPPLSFLTVMHGLVFTAWLALFITQAALIAADRPALHRQFGILGAILFGAMISLGCSTALTAGRLGHAPPGSPTPLAFMALPLMTIAGATLLVAAALWNRRRPDRHKRLMLASLFSMTGPGVHRIAIGAGLIDQGMTLTFIVADLLLVAAIIQDARTHRRVHPAYWSAAAVFAAIQAGVLWAFQSPAWLSFAQGLTATS